MRHLLIPALAAIGLLHGAAAAADAQILGRIRDRVKQRVEETVDRAVDDAVDAATSAPRRPAGEAARPAAATGATAPTAAPGATAPAAAPAAAPSVARDESGLPAVIPGFWQETVEGRSSATAPAQAEQRARLDAAVAALKRAGSLASLPQGVVAQPIRVLSAPHYQERSAERLPPSSELTVILTRDARRESGSGYVITEPFGSVRLHFNRVRQLFLRLDGAGEDAYRRVNGQQWFLAPLRVGELGGFPRYETGVLVTRRDVPVWLPVTQEQWIQGELPRVRARLQAMRESGATQSDDGLETRAQLEARVPAMEAELAAMSPAERAAPAHVMDVDGIATSDENFYAELARRRRPSGLTAEGTRVELMGDTHRARAVVSINPAFFDATLPASEAQLLLVKPDPHPVVGTRSTLAAQWNQLFDGLDWGALAALVR